MFIMNYTQRLQVQPFVMYFRILLELCFAVTCIVSRTLKRVILKYKEIPYDWLKCFICKNWKNSENIYWYFI